MRIDNHKEDLEMEIKKFKKHIKNSDIEGKCEEFLDHALEEEFDLNEN